MDILEKKLIKSYILDYLKKKVVNFVIKTKTFTCPKCGQISANIFPTNSGKVFCYNKECQKIGDIFQVCRMLDFDNNNDVPDEDIAKYLKKEFKIQTNDDLNKLLKGYVDRGWQCFPLQPNLKSPVEGVSWLKNSTCNLIQFQEWVDANLGLGLHLGEKSNCIALDIDNPETQKKMDHLLKEETLTQITRRGRHFCYNYDKVFDKTNIIKIEDITELGFDGYDVVGKENRYYKNNKDLEFTAPIKQFKNSIFKLFDTGTTSFIGKLYDKDDLDFIFKSLEY